MRRTTRRETASLFVNASSELPPYLPHKECCWKMKADNEESRVRRRDRKKADSPNWASGSHHNWSYIHPRLLSGASVNFVGLVKHVELSFRHSPPKASWPVHWMHISFTFTKWSRDRRRMAQGKPSHPWKPARRLPTHSDIWGTALGGALTSFCSMACYVCNMSTASWMVIYYILFSAGWENNF